MASINPTIPPTSTRYFTNARGVNYVTPLVKEWEKSGWLPRIPPDALFGNVPAFGDITYDASAIFGGTNKTAMWWYYDSEENDHYLEVMRGIGMNSIRVFLDYYVWEADRETHLTNVDDFLRLCDKHKIRCQFAVWDGIHLGHALGEGSFPDSVGQGVAEPTAPNSLDSVPHGLACSWHRVPHAFEYSSIPQAEDFFTNRATPYLNDIIETVKDHQSMWSFDLMNEFDNDTARVFASSTGTHLKEGLSSIGITITIGNGAGFDPGMASAYLATGGTSGSLNVFYSDMSSVLDFASFHSYGNTRYSIARYVNEGIDGSLDTGMPAMSNESQQSEMMTSSAHIKDITYFDKDFGVISYGIFLENSLSRLPFLPIAGLFYDDGTVRLSTDADQYLRAADSEDWFSPSQLVRTYTAKTDSLDGGIDGGFASGITHSYDSHLGASLTSTHFNPKHVTYSPHFSGVNQNDWEINRDIVYLVLNTGITLYGGSHSGASVTYPPQIGQHNSLTPAYSLLFGASGVSISDIVDGLYTLSSLPTLASYDSDGLIDRNNQILYMKEVLRNIIFSTFDSNLNAATRKQLTGTVWDYNVACTSGARGELETAWEDLGTLTGNTILPSIDDITLTLGDFSLSNLTCHANSYCLYTGGGGVPGVGYVASPANADIDWAAYDTFFDNLIVKMAECVQQHTDYAALTDSDFGLI